MKTDVLVIGAGPGGYVSAIKLAKLGRKVVLVDKDKLGGECLNYGCIPSKALIHAAGLAHKARKASGLGISGELRTDWAAVQRWKGALLAGMGKNIASLCRANGVETLAGEASFTAPHGARVRAAESSSDIEFECAVIAVGSRALSLPGFAFDGAAVLGSKEALDLTEPPARLAVIGGGVIGLEIGTFFAKLGSRVVVVELTDQLLPGVEAELVQPVARSLEKLGVQVHLGSKALGLEKRPEALALRLQTPGGASELAVDKVLLSVGRSPVTQGLGLDAAGVRVDARGFIPVDAAGRTSLAHIYAIGDVVGPPYLAHKASQQGVLAALSIAGLPAVAGAAPAVAGAVPVPSAIFTDPEIAFVGETSAQAEARGIAVRTGKFPFAASGRAQSARESDGFVKVVAAKEDGRILGVGIVGPSASDLIGEACLALRLKATLGDVAHTLHPHPTLSEAFVEACEAALGQAIHLLPPRSPAA